MGQTYKGDDRVLVQARLQQPVAIEVKHAAAAVFPNKSMLAPFVADAMALGFERPDLVKDFHDLGVFMTSRDIYDLVRAKADEFGVSIEQLVNDFFADAFDRPDLASDADRGGQELFQIDDNDADRGEAAA